MSERAGRVAWQDKIESLIREAHAVGVRLGIVPAVPVDAGHIARARSIVSDAYGDGWQGAVAYFAAMAAEGERAGDDPADILGDLEKAFAEEAGQS